MAKITTESARQQWETDPMTHWLYPVIKDLMLHAEPCPDGAHEVACPSCQALVIAAYMADYIAERDEVARLAQ